MAAFRTEKDSMGEVRVPVEAYWGAQTQRAVDNFPVSGRGMPRRFIQALGSIKWAAAQANEELGVVEPKLADAIRAAAREVIDGALDEHFPVDVFQTGSGTSSNMNANEVIAHRACEILSGDRASKQVHPNDHVNASQSSNDVIPTAIHLAALAGLREDLVPALTALAGALRAKAEAWADVVKAGRTHLMDATPVTFGQEFGGYATQIAKGIERIQDAEKRLAELALGGTAVGSGLNADRAFVERVLAILADRTGLPVREADDHFEAQGGKDACLEASGVLRTIAASMMKVANDVRWMGSGPRAGIAELRLPDLQPGSSIMPGKVNPVMPEMVTQVAAQVYGNDATVAMCGAMGNFELNVFMPVIARNLLESIALLSAAARLFVEKCVEGLEVDAERARELVERTFPIVTALVPAIGYDRCAEISKEAFKTNRGIREVALERGVDAAVLDKALDVLTMARGGVLS
ncbi:MAG TPA: class II fumarate hydratase [Actinomycetota bacterium]